MRDLFPGYYPPTKAVLSETWENGVISLDTNVLLDVFRVSENTAEQLLATLEKLRDRLWLPYHVADEYHGHLESVVAEQLKPYDDTKKNLEALLASLSSARNHPFVDDDLLNDTQQVFARLGEALSTRRQKLEGLLNENPYKERIAALFAGRIGPPLSEEERSRIATEGATRFAAKIPPGFADKDKPEPERYGDLFIWESLIAHLSEKKAPGIFVTSDVKEDWFLRVAGRTIGPRPELVAEVKKRADVPILLYPTPSFLGYANDFLGAQVLPEAIREVKALEDDRRRRFLMSRQRVEAVRNLVTQHLGADTPVTRYRSIGQDRMYVEVADGRRFVANLRTSALHPLPEVAATQPEANPSQTAFDVAVADNSEAAEALFNELKRRFMNDLQHHSAEGKD